MESNLRDHSIKQQSHDEKIEQLGSTISTIDRRGSSIEGNNEQQHEVTLQRFNCTDALLQQLVRTPYRGVERGAHPGEANSLPHHDDHTLQLAAENSVAEAAEEAARCSAKLMNNPKSLHTLQNE